MASIVLDGGSTASQNEGNPGGAGASFVLNLTRDAIDVTNGVTAYRLQIFNTDATFSDDFAGGGSQNFTWVGGGTTMQYTLTAVPDATVEGNDSPIIWLNRGAEGSPVATFATGGITLVNDDTGPPVFSSAATVNAAENQTAVTTVVAASGSTPIVYSKTGGADQGLFTLDSTTGVLTFTAAKNYEAPDDAGANKVYNIQITATGGGVATVQDLVVNLTNVNETPVITSNGGGDAATGVGAVAENTTAVLASATATDVDVGDTLTWSISGGADASAFVINSQTGALSFAAPPNFEAHADAGANDVFDVTIRATDAGGLFDEQTVAVALTDANDPAVISSYGGADLLFVRASENTATTVTLATIVAADQDAGSTITYSKSGPDAAAFNIDAATGVLTFATSPDFEVPTDVGADNSYDVTITATPTSGAVDTQRLLVFIDNVIEPGETSGGGGGFVLPTPPSPPAPPAPGAGDDSVLGSAAGDVRDGGAGNDTLDGGGGDDSLDGGDGDDDVYGSDGNDFLRGLNDSDYVSGGEGNDTVNGNLGNDYVEGGNGADVVYGGQGSDEVFGGEGNDSYVNGNIGNDTVHGDGGNDTVYGGQNDDVIYGDGGNDLLSGDLGNDLLYGGDGADRFTIAPTGGSDWVIDFNGTAGDRVQLAAGTSYSIGSYQGQVLITVGGTATIGLAGVGYFDPSWVVFA